MKAHEIIKNLYVGDDDTYERVKNNLGWSFLRATKEGPGGHRQTLGYSTLAAPAGPNYLWIRRGKLLALNLIDVDDPEMIPDEVIDKGLKFIDERMRSGDKVLVACEAGHNRSATLALMYLRTIGELPQGFDRAQHIFKTIYSKYEPRVSMRTHARTRWDELKDKYAGK
jgi:hypothetical protein